MRKSHILRTLILCPFRQVLANVEDVILAPIDLGQVCLVDGFPKVALARFDDGGFIICESVKCVLAA